MKTDFYHLKVVPIEKILVHEEMDMDRVEPLVKKIKAEGRLANPIIVANLDNGKYLQLDGMNRLQAFKKLGYKTILVQIVDYNDQENVDLSTWTHLFNVDKKKFIQAVKQIPGIVCKRGTVENVGHRYIREKGLGRLCTICAKDNSVYLIFTNGDLMDKIAKLNEIVKLYDTKIVRDVLLPYLNTGDIQVLFDHNPQTNMMLVFPTITRHQVVKVVEKGGLLPTGLTRHIIRGRCLNVNMDLAIFNPKYSLKKQNQLAKNSMENKIHKIFEEKIVYFE